MGWSLKRFFPRLLTTRLQAYNSFRSASMDFLDSRPDFEIAMQVHRVELVRSEALSEASLDMTLTLRDGRGETILSHRSNRMQPLYSTSMELYVQTLNELILEEFDIFIDLIYAHFDERPAAARRTAAADDEQHDLEAADAPDGHGILLMPSISGIRETASFLAIDRQGREYQGVFGEDLALPAGEYHLLYGSGSAELQMQQRGVQVRRGYRTLVRPDWGELTVEIIDERRTPQDILFEVFDAEGTSYISRFPAREELGDSPDVIHLPPGLYKITLDNEPFNTYRNFTTIQIEEGKWKRLTVVVDTTEGPVRMIGAGIIDDELIALPFGNWNLSSSLHAVLNFIGSHRNYGADGAYSATLTGQLDNQLRYQQRRTTLNILQFSELGLGWDQDSGIEIREDDFDLRTAGILDVYRNLGVYARFDLNTHFFPVYDRNLPEDADPVVLEPPLFPLLMREGVGLNLRLLNAPRASLTLRSGFGLRQEFNRGVQRVTSDGYEDLEDDTSVGLEVSAMGGFRPLRRVQLNTTADLLFPLLEGENIILEWSTGLNWLLLRPLSLNYRFIVSNTPQSDLFELNYSHRLVLRLSYLLN